METIDNINMSEENITNIFTDYLKLQREYNQLKKDYDTLQSKSSTVLMEWDLTWDRHSPELCSLGSALKDLGDVLDKGIGRKND